MALAHLGASKPIADLDVDSTAEARACRIFYEESLKAVLAAFPWSFAKKELVLTRVGSAPTVNWRYSYRYPPDCLNFRYIQSGVDRQRTVQNAIKCELSSDATGELIYSDETAPIGVYTKNLTDVSKFPPNFVLAFSLHLAAMIAPMVTAGDPFKLGQRALGMWKIQYTVAANQNANQEQPDERVDSDLIRGRE